MNSFTHQRKNFNPRSREGSDEVINMSRGLKTNFNPRSREGSDSLWPFLAFLRDCISIHAPAKGATWHRHGANVKYKISIHAPAKGATQSAIF